MRTRSTLCLLSACVRTAFGQIPDITVASATSAANNLAGSNVTTSNATFAGHPNQLATFTDGTDKIGFEEGVAITTGNASFAGTFGTGNVGDASPTGTAQGDPDLELLIGGGSNVDNAGVLQFDFVTTATSVAFEFVFASEEYLEYVGSGYNDAFGFFLSGPGITGPFSGGAVNLATLGGSPISVNTVNPFSNSAYYIDNEFDNPLGNPLNEGNAQFAYDGLTVVMNVSYAVQCNVPYHVKLAICNTNDNLFDSGVFIRKGTLNSPYSAPGPLTILPPLICEGDDLTLTVGGDPAWNYFWSTGQSGVGLQEITTPAIIGVNTYSVTAEYLPGCSLSIASLPGEVTIHENNNVPPICNGGDLFVQAGDPLHVYIPTLDSPNEFTTISLTSGPPGGSFTIVDVSAQQDVGHFFWQPTDADLGFYTLEVTVIDNNVCGILSSTCVFNIKVICRYCPIDVYYENRTPGGLPLPDLTIAGHRIVAGEDVDPGQTNGPVNTGPANVEFRAMEILLEPGFMAGPNFLAVADPNTCVDDCDDCCDTWVGFTAELPLPNVFTPNGDGVNDFWYVKDQLHPYCAFSASGFDLEIRNSWGDLLYDNADYGFCCPFQAPAPGFAIPHSSIYWDGYTDVSAGGFCAGCPVSDGVYYYILWLYSDCGSSQDFTGYIHIFGSPGVSGGGGQGMMQQVSDTREALLLPKADLGPTQGAILQGVDKEVVIVPLSDGDPIRLFPNPTSGLVTLRSFYALDNIEVCDALGRVVLAQQFPPTNDHVLDLNELGRGAYVVRMRDVRGRSYTVNVIKQ